MAWSKPGSNDRGAALFLKLMWSSHGLAQIRQ